MQRLCRLQLTPFELAKGIGCECERLASVHSDSIGSCQGDQADRWGLIYPAQKRSQHAQGKEEGEGGEGDQGEG